ncbi:hypothetical protein FOCC_FOCC014911 [Frankliniella occidentalis]|nr:hypothetical protein FOCC_FOCC014911 [Frankliniella occidentalis]
MGSYLKLIYPAREIPEMMSPKMPLLHAFARSRAIKEQPNMVQYAPNLAKDKYTKQIEQLNLKWDRLLMLTTAEAQQQTSENYGANAEKAKILMEGGDPVQGTSIPSERVFSVGGRVVTDFRHYLTGTHINQLMFRSMNRAFVKK